MFVNIDKVGNRLKSIHVTETSVSGELRICPWIDSKEKKKTYRTYIQEAISFSREARVNSYCLRIRATNNKR